MQEIGFHYTRDAFIKNTYDLEDIFHNETMTSLKNRTNFEVDTIFTLIYGRCFVIRKIINVTIIDYDTYFDFKTNWDVQLYIHNLGNTSGLFRIKKPLVLIRFNLDIKVNSK